MKILKTFILLFFLTGISVAPQAAGSEEVKNIAQKGLCTVTTEEIFLWPGKAPGSEDLVFDETVEDLSKDPAWKTRRITLVVKPSITVFHPEKPNGIAVLIAPGGGYIRMGFDDEGTDIAKWLNSLGITGCVLKYRFPDDGHRDGMNVPLEDAQRAIRMIRDHAGIWKVNPKKVGVMGFSAGGHLAAMLSTRYDLAVYKAVDAADGKSARPDFTALLYPVISNLEDKAPQEMIDASDSQKNKMLLTYQPHLQVTPETPPAFILLADDDQYGLQLHGPMYYKALRRANVPAELHVFLKGRHGFGVRRPVGAIAAWTDMFSEWLKGAGIAE
jgi:acetyl esterase/lipase